MILASHHTAWIEKRRAQGRALVVRCHLKGVADDFRDDGEVSQFCYGWREALQEARTYRELLRMGRKRETRDAWLEVCNGR